MLPSQPRLTAHHSTNGSRLSPSASHPLKRSRTPYENDSQSNGVSIGSILEKDTSAEDAKKAQMHSLYSRTEQRIARLFEKNQSLFGTWKDDTSRETNGPSSAQQKDTNIPPFPPKRAARAIADDDYGDDDEDEEEAQQDTQPMPVSPLQSRSAPTFRFNDGPILGPSLSRQSTTASSNGQAKTSEEARKQLEQEKKAAEDAARQSVQTRFYTLENDRDAMLEQQKLDELDRQVEAEAAGEEAAAAKENETTGAGPRQGTLSSTNLGASSLTLKHLIGRIDAKRIMVQASDQRLRTLMSEVRKNRSKWANEERVGQEELYESAERVLMELKARTEWSAPFLQKVNKREAPDYYHVIKQPMDIGTMLKKLKSLAYQSKKDFCDDLDLIWNNCFRYNANPENFLRKKAEHMKKETAKLVPLIPDITIRSRAAVEAEEKRLQIEFDDGEESDDEPLKTTRGRKAPGKSSKKGATTARKAPPSDEGAAVAPDAKTNDVLATLKNEHLRGDADSTREGSLLGFSTPPRGETPAIMNGAASQADASELDMPDVSIIGATHAEELEQEDEEYKTWKQVTKRDRAHAAASRQRMFLSDKLNLEEPALLRSKAGMRKWLRTQKTATQDSTAASPSALDSANKDGAATTLQEEIDDADESALPDYYDPLAAVPQINDRISWREDVDGHAIEQREECLRVVPKGSFTSCQSALSSKLDNNMRQMQDTRKIVAKIAIVKQMQVQTQTYQNQFQKYEPEPFVEADIPATVVSDEGPIMDANVCRAALRRSVGKLFYHAGFEEFQPSALDVVTDLAGAYFANLANTLATYAEDVPKVYKKTTAQPSSTALTTATPLTRLPMPTDPQIRSLRPKFSREEAMLHTLRTYGHDLDSLDHYAHDELDRHTLKLEAYYLRTRDYLAELLRPALDPTMVGTDGVGAFSDNSEQFVGGDFAEDIDEDFFGFRELGLDKEFGLAGLSVPLHLLQSRIQTLQPGANAVASSSTVIMEAPESYPPVTYSSLESQIGLVQDFFRKKLDVLASTLADNERDDIALIEDDQLPVKQRFPKPRLPPTGKISSPRKRPIREQQMMARKKRRLEIEAARERERQVAAGTETGNNPKPDGDTGGAIDPDADADGEVDNEADVTTMTNGAMDDTALNDGDTNMLDLNGGDISPTTTTANAGNESGFAFPPSKSAGKMRPISKLKFEVPQDDSNTATQGNGDPAKAQRPSSSGANGAAEEDEEGDEDLGRGGGQGGKGLNGVLSPIAAH